MAMPTNPNKIDGLMGKDFLFDLNTGTAEIPIWKTVGGQRSGSLKRPADEIDASTKNNDGWGSAKSGQRKWSLEAGAVIVQDDEAADALEDAFEQGIEINARFRYKNGKSFVGWGSITDFSLDAPHDDIASLSITISGNGPLKKETAADTGGEA